MVKRRKIKRVKRRPKYYFYLFLITIIINERYFRFSYLFICFLCKFIIIFVKSNLNHKNHILNDTYANILNLVT